MGNFFNLDGPFNRFGNVLADIIILSLLWIVFSLPIFSAGASTTALFYVASRRISDKEGYVMRDFWMSFKRNFLQATLLWVVILLFACIFLFTIYNGDAFGEMKSFVLPIQAGFFLELILINVFIFPIVARFDMKTLDVVKSAIFMANRHILTSLLCLSIMGAVIFLIFMFPPVFIMAAGIYAFAASYFIMRVFKRYRPDIDADADTTTDGSDAL